MTKREVLSIIRNALSDNADVVAYCDNEVALLDKKNEYRKTHPTKTKAQKENEELYPVVLAVLTVEPQTPTEIANAIGLSVQKTTGLLSKLLIEGNIVKTVVKGKSYYGIKG